MFDVVGVGTNSLDSIITLPQQPAADTTAGRLPIVGRRESPGGQMATALVTCAGLGLRTAYVGAFGDDDAGHRMRALLDGRGIETSHCPTRPVPNRYALILLDEHSGERIVLWHRSPALSLDDDELPVNLLGTARAVHVDDEDEPMALAGARIGRRAGAIVTSDIDNVTVRTRELVEAVTVPIFAQHVPGELTGEQDYAAALRLLRQPHHLMLCVTLGPKGSMLLAGDTVYRQHGMPVKAVDTTGAGDVFRGVFLHGLLGGLAPAETLQRATVAAALACTRMGAIESVPTREELAEGLSYFFSSTNPSGGTMTDTD